MHAHEELLAALDIGTNTILLLVGRSGPGGAIEVLEDHCRTPRLGESLALRGEISAEAAERALRVLEEFADRLSALGIPRGRTRAVGTAVLRRARNAQEFLGRARDATGIEIEVLGAEEEARLAHLAVAGELNGERAAVIDVGGGSTEYTSADGARRLSAAVGAVVLSETYLGEQALQPGGFPALLEAARRAVQLFPEGDAAGEELVVLGGTAVNLACLERGFERFDALRAEGTTLSPGSAAAWAGKLAQMPFERRLDWPIERERAAILPAGLACLAAAIERVRPRRLRASGRGLRFGALRDLCARLSGGSPDSRQIPTRAKSRGRLAWTVVRTRNRRPAPVPDLSKRSAHFLMRKSLLALGFCLPVIGACVPQGGSSAGPVADLTGAPQPAPLTREEIARKFFETGPGAVPEGGIPDAGLVSPEMQNSLAPLGMGVRMVPVPGYPGAYNVQLRNTGTGFLESFVLQVPPNPPPGPRPMLVAFHRYGVSHADAFLWTKFPQDCMDRGWYFVAPLGGQQKHFSSSVSQINTQRALEVVCASFPIDPTRIYGVGFSMGGGAASTFAARHLDPNSVRFAAVVNHTGTVSLSHAYYYEKDDDDIDDGPAPAGANLEPSDLMEFWNAGTPVTAGFAYSGCSTIDIDPLTGVVNGATDLARNFMHMKVMTWLSSADGTDYLPLQTQTWVGHLGSLGVDNTFVTVNYPGHSWNALDVTTVDNWLANISLQEPTSGNQLADGDGQQVFGFLVQQDQPGTFTPFQWLTDANQNRLSTWGGKNLKRLTLDVTTFGLAYLGSLRWNHSAADATADEIMFTNVPWAPLQVLRDGQPASGTYDAQAGTFLVNEPSSAGHQWVFQF